MTLVQIAMQEKKLKRSLNYYTKCCENGKLSEDDFNIKIRPITYSLKWLLTLKKIDGLTMDIKNIRQNALSLLKLGTSDNFQIQQINGKISSDLDFEDLFSEVSMLFEKAINSLQKSSKKIHSPDLLDNFLDNENEGIENE